MESTIQVYIDKKEKRNLISVLVSLGLARRAAINIVLHWERTEAHHGIMKVVGELKLYCSDLVTPGNAIRKHLDGTWRGYYRPISRVAQKGRRGLRSALKALKLSGRWEAHAVTTKHVKTFIETVSQKGCSSEILLEHVASLRASLSKEDRYNGHLAEQVGVFTTTYPLGPKTSPSYGLVPLDRSAMTPLQHVECAIASAPNLCRKHHQFLNMVMLVPSPLLEDDMQKADIVGIVTGLVKDRGMKVRFVANPLMLFQVALTRLKSACRDYLETACPESNVFNQDLGADWIQKQLSGGYSLTSLDLKSCSDRLPADPQFALLKELFPSLIQDVELFRDLAKAEYLINHDDFFGETLSWNVGQPLGSEPSFFSFTVYLIHIIRLCGGDASSFRVIGDDLVIRSDLESKVLETYGFLKVPINMAKSIWNSKRLAEFAGRYVDKRGSLFVYKASPFDLERDPLGMIRQYGLTGLRLVPKRVRKMLGIVSLLPTPVGVNIHPGLLKRLPASVINRLYAPRFKEITPPSLLVHPILQKFWQNTAIREVELDLTLDDEERRQELLSAIHLFPLNYVQRKKKSGSRLLPHFPTSICKNRERFTVEELILDKNTLSTYVGVGVWLVKSCMPYDVDRNESIHLFNELVRRDPRLSSHVDLIADIYSRLSQDSDEEPERLPVKVDKKPLLYVKMVYKRVKKFFTGKTKIK